MLHQRYKDVKEILEKIFNILVNRKMQMNPQCLKFTRLSIPSVGEAIGKLGILYAAEGNYKMV